MEEKTHLLLRISAVIGRYGPHLMIVMIFVSQNNLVAQSKSTLYVQINCTDYSLLTLIGRLKEELLFAEANY